MEKLDLRKQYKDLYKPSPKKVVVVDVPELSFVMIDGEIEPGQAPGTSPGLAGAMQAMYGVSYTLKFMSKKRAVDTIDYSVMALEGLWWVNDGDFDINKKDNWSYTLMMMQPDHITPEMFAQATRDLKQKHPEAPTERLHLERWAEGPCMQIMHLGPYSDEPATVALMKAFAHDNGYAVRGKHHEIYLGDPRTAKPENLQTVLRQPVKRVEGSG